MDFETLIQKYEFKKIKTGYTYNGANLRITDISRKDGENMTRKQMIKLCDAFLSELRLKYPEAEGIVSVSISTVFVCEQRVAKEIRMEKMNINKRNRFI